MAISKHIEKLGAGYNEPGDHECIILAGGLGTRLRSAVPDLPKCMAPVAGRPFLAHLIDALQKQGVQRFIFSLGYKQELIAAFLQSDYPSLLYKLSIEDEPLGTGGAIAESCKLATRKNVVVCNGDTFYEVNIIKLMSFHVQQNAVCTLALKPMKQFDRYGVVETDSEWNIRSFREKQYYETGLINGGVYALQVAPFLELPFEKKFSFERDFLEKYCGALPIKGLVQDGYFIDIGIPADFEKAQKEFSLPLK